MTIQVLGLRGYFSKKNQKNMLFEKWFNVEAETTERLFNSIEKVIECIPQDERYNLFYTMAHTQHRDRNREAFVSCDVIAFDIDDIFTEQKEHYLEPLSIALKVDLSKCGVIWTGNGIQIIIKLKDSVGKEFFENKSAYQYWGERINKGLETAGLPGHCDTSVFEPARVLRLPLSKNIKPMENLSSPDRKEKESTFYNSKLEYCGWELGEAPPKKEKALIDKDAPVDVKSIMENCKFLQYVQANQEKMPEPLWRAGLGITAFFKDGDKTSHAISDQYPGYSYEETQAQCERIREETTGPRLCEGINTLWGKCKECAFYNTVKTPLQIRSNEFHLKELDVYENKKPDEMQVVYQLLKNFKIHFDIATTNVSATDSYMIKDRESGDIFQFTGTHWELFDEEDALKRVIDKYYGNKAADNKLESTYKHFKKYIPQTEKDRGFYIHNPYALTLLNGTLHLIENDDGSFNLELHPHNKDDLLACRLDYNYIPGSKEFNPYFMDMLNRCFDYKIEPDMSQDEINALEQDKQGRILAIAQMFGAALMPVFPQVFFLEGITRSGKSQIAMCLYHLIGKKNFSSVEPHEMKGFHLEGMAGKLINLVTDIKTSEPISDNVFKQIEDRVPKRIQRKNRTDLFATIPGVHVFAGNNMPKNFDSSSQAYARRATIVKFFNQVPEGSDRKNYAEYVFRKDPQGIFNFAVWGLTTLAEAKGFFHRPESAKKAMNKWTLENDIIALFLEDFGEGCLSDLVINDQLKINRTELWELFEEWRDECGRKQSKMVRNNFFKALEQKGYKQAKIKGTNFIKGIGKETKNETAEF